MAVGEKQKINNRLLIEYEGGEGGEYGCIRHSHVTDTTRRHLIYL